MTVELLICTLNTRIAHVCDMLLPPAEGISYLVSWQRTNHEAQNSPIPTPLEQRQDVRVVCTTSCGLSANRNHAFAHAQGDILVIADDDCRYTPESLSKLQHVYEANPQAIVVTARMTDEDGHFFKKYPDRSFNFTHIPRKYFTSSWEITLRKEAAAIPFDTAFGIGAPSFGCGEEEVWLYDVCRTFGRDTIVYVPHTLGTTAPATTGTRFLTDKKVQRTKGAVLSILHGRFGATLRVAKTAFSAPVSFISRLLLLKEMLIGIFTVRHLTPSFRKAPQTVCQ